MTSKQRVFAALNREQTDRVPIFMWFHPDTTRRLAILLDIPASSVAEAMGNDVRQTWVNNNYAMEGIIHAHDGESHIDYWGIEWTRKSGFNQITKFPLINALQKELLSYQFPEIHINDLLNQMLPIMAMSKEYFIGCDVSPCAFEMYWRLRGMEKTIIELAAEHEIAYKILEKCADFSIKLAEKAFERFKLDWLWTGDDVASQQSMMMSPQCWRKLIKPHMARIFSVAKSRGRPVAYHCCGALYPIIGDLIEIGLDVLNPIQSNCPDMDPFELKKEFGKHLTFMGGIDTQNILPYGTVDEVRKYTKHLIENMTVDGGGYILAASHTIPPETPDENIFAMYEMAGISREEIFDRAAMIRKKLLLLQSTQNAQRNNG